MICTYILVLYKALSHNKTRIMQHMIIVTLYDNDLDVNFTESEIRNAVFSQNNSKSSDTDHLIAEVFKSSYDIIAPLLVSLYSRTVNECIFPNSWGEGIIIHIFKGGNPDAKSFRGITLYNIISNIYSKLLVTRPTKWSEKKEKTIDNQFASKRAILR